MATLLFVHGTGVREKAFKATLETITAKAAANVPGVAVKGCFWGDKYGAKLHHDGKSIPRYADTRGITDADSIDEELAAWACLLQDPLIELRLLVETQDEGGPRPGGRVTAGEALLDAVREATRSGTCAMSLPNSAWSDVVRKTLADLPRDEMFAALVTELEERDAEAELTLARCLTAASMANAEEEGLAALDGATRDALVAAVLACITQDRARRGAVLNRLARPLLGMATWWGKRRRGRLSDAALEEPGDILLYQGRGKPIRDFIRGEIAARAGDVILYAHSLGGIMSVDLLIEGQLPAVRGLITLGSQAPFLYETGALVNLAHTDPLPRHFPPWLNVYDRADFLSYKTSGVFSAANVRDYEAVSRQPFPLSHSAYFSSDAVWGEIDRFVQLLK